MQNLLDPAILYFVFGVAAGTVKSNLDIPQPISRFLSLYLLMALGLKGGFALAHSGFTSQVASSLACAVILAVAIPALGYQVLRRFVPPFDAAAISATYGSVSAVTFITAAQYLENQGLAYGGHMAAAMALMESPAIVMAVIFANSLRQRASATAGGDSVQLVGGGTIAAGGPPMAVRGSYPVGKILHESFTDGAQLLLLGSIVIGIVTGDAGKTLMQPFTGDLFRGLLAFFLLDMGLLAARNVQGLRGKSPWLLGYAAVAPLVHAGLALGLSALAGIPAGNAALLMVLAASASYIAVPAVLRYAMPEANPSLYFGMSLGITFPLNIVAGIPLYAFVAHRAMG